MNEDADIVGFLWATGIIVLLVAPVLIWGLSPRGRQFERERKIAQAHELKKRKLRGTLQKRLSERIERRKANFIDITEREFVSRHTIVYRGDWITTDLDKRSEAEIFLKSEAFHKGYNGVVKLNFRISSSRELGGYSRNGNPFFRTTPSREWEGQPVILKAKK